MLHFPEEYFNTEIRDGFAISELMKRNWAAQLEILNKVIEICDKYNLTYYVYWGTLLGAVRHQGYIPWDDDLDIAMKKDDYIKFLEVIQTELTGELCIYNCYTKPDCYEVFTRLTNGSSLLFSDERMVPYHNCPLVVGIDIFPLYYIPRDADELGTLKMILGTISNMIVSVGDPNAQKTQADNMAIAKGLVNLEKLTGYHFNTDRPILNQLYILYDQVSQLFDEEESDELTVFPHYMKKGYSVKKELLAEGIQLPFEHLMVNVPKGYDEILKKSYKDYMTPRKIRAAHGYPYYKEQLQIWGKYLEKDDRNWKMQHKSDRMDCEGQLKNKKVILYYSSGDALMCYGAHAIKKMQYVFNIFSKNPDVILWWVPFIFDNPAMPYLQKMVPQLVKDYRQMTEEFQRNNWGIYDDTGDVQRAITMADAYYGDESDLLQMFLKTGKVAMIQDYELGD